ncbi:MAG: hypothetical protein CFE23_00880 [Flavobacterium sp. BFFFF1]|uniref:hypothetical protein n=1 Tax=Flavobacterium sp. BFFFF1 TaxID=2015557 RepID=UPI000BC7FE38|nr:hypothetical protein [Flavobacterium sp. BFFFF1]OYU82302.1 MAG: hypothetical protein CFE23_00880 [Flavobacterium sp. BFFFF1]
MKEENKFELVVHQGRRPLWKTFLAAVLFTAMFYFLYDMFLITREYAIIGSSSKQFIGDLKWAAMALSGGISLSIMKSVMIDLDKNRIISKFYVGPFYRNIHSEIPRLEYVSVFLDGKGYYQVNLWYQRNKHYNMYAFENKKSAMQFAAKVALKLKINLLDATEKGNFHRVDPALI